MSKTDIKFYVCVHEGCAFETSKRKAIYTHLVRTHSERKEDYECEYCSTVFEDEALVEDHLTFTHPDKQFTYTCVSRIENIINRCAKLGEDKKNGVDVKKELCKGIKVKNEGLGDRDDTKDTKTSTFNRTKASVNESLNNLAAKNQTLHSSQSQAYSNKKPEDHSSELVSQPGSLKVKLNLKKIAECSTREARERSTSPPKLEPQSPRSEFYPDSAAGSPPDILPSQGPDGISVREKASKYFDRLEVYHTTDEHGRRCCPFCDYKTGKNTIRVHLAGIHKIFFVKCSLCEYKAAFPHQVTQHGVKFHKTTNLNVIQLSKESRERTIAKLKSLKKINPANKSSVNNSLNSSAENSMDTDTFDGDNYSTGSSSVMEDDGLEPEVSHIDSLSRPEMFTNSNSSLAQDGDSMNSGPEKVIERTYPAPKSQMAKTDYFTIKVVNGVHLYCCNFCNFTTHVRATIYTHKYRHEDDSYKCGYCDFTSSPRSNVVNHLRSRHKNKTIVVTLVDGARYDEGTENTASKQGTDGVIKQEHQTVSQFVEIMEQNPVSENTDKPTIINVPQYKRTLTSAFNGDHVMPEGQSKKKKPESDNYKLSLNKMYKVNPTGASPKYVCVECSYGCDTHPKMKHHLYRHRPQQYKCPYCDHRKYPRSYVVRHVRDTHRDKPVRVIDLSIGPEPIDIPEYMDDNDDEMGGLNEQNEEMDVSNDANESQDQPEETEVRVSENSDKTDDLHDVGHSEGNDDMLSSSLKSTKSIIDNVNQTPPINTDFLDDSNDVNPNFSEAVYTSTPLIESLINGNYEGNDVTPEPDTKPTQKTPMFRKKSTKDYRINYGDGARYICNICNYQTENYKTIHNHMYRHDSQKYQCPYCGYRRSPKSFVENHIREVHRGHPLFVTELKDDLEHRVPMGSPRQCVMSQKKREINGSVSQEKEDLNLPNPSKLHIKWPAPEPSSQVNINQPSCSNTSPLQIPVLQKAPNAVVVPNAPLHLSAHGNAGNLLDNRTNLLPSSVMPPNVSPFQVSSASNGVPRSSVFLTEKLTPQGIKSPVIQNPFKFKEPSRTTYKTMYKCVFDPETCNHISKDKSKMKQHLFMHVEYKPWSCDLCDMTASQSSHLRNHVRSEHHGASEMSFRYKKHNYLEKHIDTFLAKGLFTVPVNEFRMIMDMKGNTKKAYLTEYKRDAEGFLYCPHCDYKTKSASMTDHVKMKHMQPRFKCHWCNYKAFYRSEIRRHHKKERAHGHLEFKVQELDLKEVVEGMSGAKTKDQIDEPIRDSVEEQAEQTNQILDPVLAAETSDLADEQDEDGDTDDDDDDDDASSSEDLSMFFDYSTGKVKRTDEQHETKDNESRDCLEESTDEAYVSQMNASESVNDAFGNNSALESIEMSQTTDKEEIEIALTASTNAKFKCGYCSFSAALRVKIKMHCSKKHSDKELYVIEPFVRYQSDNQEYNGSNVMQVSCSELKGTKFEADLKRVGVSKLNLTSLFPSYGQNSLTRSQVHDKNNDAPDNVQETIRASKPPTVKKEEKSSKLDMLIMKLSKNKSAIDNDSEFKRPKDPIRPGKFVDKRKERKPNPVFTKETVAPGLNAVKAIKDDNEGQICKDIVIEPLPDATTGQSSEQQKPIQSLKMNTGDTLNEDIAKESIEIIPYKPEPIPDISSVSIDHNEVLYRNDGTELFDTSSHVTNVSEQIDEGISNNPYTKSSEMCEPTSEKDTIEESEKDPSENKTNKYADSESELKGGDVLVHKSLPNGSPVILETESVEDDNLQNGAKSNELQGQLSIQASA